MSKYIVTTTINSPTEATLKFCEKKDWTFIIVGDTKTPEAEYRELENKHSNVIYLSPSQQELLYKELSDVLGWKTIQRRNIGFVHAYNLGAEIIATVDDDNIPYDDWGTNLLVGKTVDADVYQNNFCNFFDPFAATNNNDLWHRGFPIEHLPIKNNISLIGRKKVHVLVQADFWDGDPDVDAICRLTKKPLIKFNPFDTFTTTQQAPFNSQNTFLHRSIFPHYSVWPNIGRMDDIWASYYLRQKFNENIVYCKPSVYQERNPQDLVKNLENECIGYRFTKQFVENNCNIHADYISENTRKFIDIYSTYFA